MQITKYYSLIKERLVLFGLFCRNVGYLISSHVKCMYQINCQIQAQHFQGVVCKSQKLDLGPAIPVSFKNLTQKFKDRTQKLWFSKSFLSLSVILFFKKKDTLNTCFENYIIVPKPFLFT